MLQKKIPQPERISKRPPKPRQDREKFKWFRIVPIFTAEKSDMPRFSGLSIFSQDGETWRGAA